jgi:organic radical activating enzyme
MTPSDLTSSYAIMEQFYTLQGEGYWSGTPAYFIRLAGCNVGCHWCDVKESWNINDHPQIIVSELLAKVKDTAAQRIVITGGEPFLQDLGPLTRVLKHNGYQLHCETSGTAPVSGVWDWICFSPKKFKAPLPDWYLIANELKVIVYQLADLAWGETHALNCTKDCQLFFQPEWDSQRHIPETIAFIQDNPHWKLSLQTHKFLGIA